VMLTASFVIPHSNNPGKMARMDKHQRIRYSWMLGGQAEKTKPV